MKIQIIAVGTKMPGWVDEGVREYCKRLPRELDISVQEIPLASRGKSTSTKIAMEKEGEKILIAAANSFKVALEKSGSMWSTEQLARQLEQWKMGGQSVSLLIGGPDGLSPDCLQKADKCWSLSALTLPHPLVRIVLMEQLYRAWSILANHPYHK